MPAHTLLASPNMLYEVYRSPDLSPIEHVWDIIRCRLQTLPLPRTNDQLWQMVQREWRTIPQDTIRTLIDLDMFLRASPLAVVLHPAESMPCALCNLNIAIQASKRDVILEIRQLVSSCGNCSHSFSNAVFISWTVLGVGLRVAIALSRASQTHYIGLRFGAWLANPYGEYDHSLEIRRPEELYMASRYTPLK
ncbi:transposable element Tc1 transposase [Trichonephila clavipes]|nr:transposable element Tc1 transposase [Trichonephila clavipes]